jgi:hypothetical protein
MPPVLPHSHFDKLNAAIANAKMPASDLTLLREGLVAYKHWIREMAALQSRGHDRVTELVRLLNQYKNYLEVQLIAKRGSDFIKRQKGQLKLDNSVIEEFLPYLICPEIIPGITHDRFITGPQQAFMSLSFMPRSFDSLGTKPEVVVKAKDQDFIIGSSIHFKFAPDEAFSAGHTSSGNFALAVLSAECKVNLDKTMFQEASGTAARLKQGCPVARYFLLVEYLDMAPEDPRLAQIDNVFLLRKTKRLPFERRSVAAEVERQHRDCPISADVVSSFVCELEKFVGAILYDPENALRTGTFV